MNESQILSAIRKALGRKPDLALWRLSQGGAMTRGGQTYRAGLSVNGASDLIGVLGPGGRMFALEVKAAKGRVSVEQAMFLALVQHHGGFAAVVRSVEEAEAAYERAKKGERE